MAANGTLDAGFNPNPNNAVRSIAVQADGRILLGGDFSTVGGSTRNLFARLLNDPATRSLSALPGGTGCSPNGAGGIDTYQGNPGWWFYLNLTAVPLTYTGP